MAHAIRRPRKTVEDWLALGEEVRAELIGGEIYVTPSSTPRHQDLVQRLCEALNAWARGRSIGRAFVAALDVHLPSGDVVQPDVLFVRTESWSIVQDAIRGVPDLVVEVVSRSHPERDRIVKRTLYAQNRVPEYWIVEPDPAAVEVLRLEGDEYRPAGWFAAGTTLVSASFPGFSLAVDDLFAPLSP